MNQPTQLAGQGDLLTEVRGQVGFITLNRPKALNALSLSMVRELLATLQRWRDNPALQAVAIRGTNKVGRPGSPESLFGGFCAGGDIRFFYRAALAGDPALDDFFTAEYTLNHLIHSYPKPLIAFMDGIVMGGGMGIGQGASVRVVTEQTRMAMPETNIGLFPDVGGGYFLSRCPGHVGEYLALTGDVIGADDAVAFGLADVNIEAARLPALWEALAAQSFAGSAEANAWIATNLIADYECPVWAGSQFDKYFSLLRVKHMIDALQASPDAWAQKTAATLRKRSPLMLHVTLEQIRRARTMVLADELRMELGMMHHCFHGRPGASSEAVEGIRALAIGNDFHPHWRPARIEDVRPAMVAAFFESPWPADAHPLRAL